MILLNKVAIVTGASRGIGKAIAQTFAREGATVVICGRKQDTLDSVAAEPLDKTVRARWKKLKKLNPVMHHLRLPASESPALLRLLRTCGVDGATVFPGYAGVVRALEERRLWDDYEPVHPLEKRSK